MEKHNGKPAAEPRVDERIAYDTTENKASGLVSHRGVHRIRRSILRKLMPQMDEDKPVGTYRDMNGLLPKGEISENETGHLGWLRSQSQVTTKTNKHHGQKEKTSTQKEAQTTLQP